MALDFAKISRDQSNSGAVSYHKGLSAEDQVIRHYHRLGAALLHQRWRGQSGEVDLIFQSGAEIVFVEVKASKSATRAAQRLSRRQMHRICTTAEEFIGTCPNGSLTPMRIDVALVDETGQINVLENALMMA